MTRLLFALLVGLFVAGANAQTFPSRPVTLLVTFPAGGPTDIAGRALAEATSKYLGQPVVVENRPGATGTLGAAALVNARPDGHTVSMLPITVLRLPHMENVAFDPIKDIRYLMGVLSVFTEKRVAVWPDAPTMTELGHGIVSTSPYGIGVPAATPPAIVKILHDAFKKGLEDPIHTKTLEKYNQPLWYLSSEDYAKWAREQYERERKLIERLGLAKKK